jgi:hypothetical protein
MIDCAITGIAQELDFEQNVTVTYLTLKLPNGSSLRVAVDDAAAATVMEQHVHTKGQPRTTRQTSGVYSPPKEASVQPPVEEEISPAPAVMQEVTSEDGTATHIFGGQDVPVAEDDTMSEEERLLLKEGSPTVVVGASPPAAPAAARSNVQRTASGKLVVPARTVPAGEKGYPVVPNAGVDTSSFTGGRDPDEDGVGSV